MNKQSGTMITHVSNPTPLGCTCAVVGDGWRQGSPEVCVTVLSNGPAGAPGKAASELPAEATFETVKVVREEDQVLTCELPGNAYRVAALRVRGDGGWSAPFFINRARIDWLSSNQVEAGAMLRLFGRNLVDLNRYPEAGADGEPVSHGGYIDSETSVVLGRDAGAAVACTVEKASAYDVHVRIPDDLPDGDYAVYLHNGLGGAAGWSEPHPVRIARCDTWPVAVFSIADFGARGWCAELWGANPADGRTHGVHDDTDALEAALEAAAQNGGGVVHIPAGGYLITRALRVPKYTVIRGESRERSWLWFPDGVDHGTREQGHACPIGFMGESHFGFENLSIHAVFNRLIIAAPLSNANAGGWNDLDKGTPGADHVFVRNCCVFQEPTYRYHLGKDDPFLSEEVMSEQSTWWGYAAIALRGDYISITDCEIKGGGMPVLFKGCRYATLARNRLHTGTAANGFAMFGGDYPVDPMPDKCIFEDNEIRPGSSRNHSGFWNHWTGSRYYFARNSIKLFWVCDVEGILFHGGGKQAIVDVKEAEGVQLTVEDAGPAMASWECVIIKGRGLGQSRLITQVEDHTMTIDRPWAIEPDASSRLAVLQCPCFKEHIVVDNRLEDTGPGIHCWGDGLDWMIDGNHLTRTGGIELETVSLASRPWSGAYFMQVQHNVLDQGRYRGHVGHMWSTGFTGTGYYRTWIDDCLANVGHVYRNNLHKNDSIQGFWTKEFFIEGQKPFEGTSDVGMIVERSRFKDSLVGIDIRHGVSVVLKDNVFENVDEWYVHPPPSL